MREAVRAAAKGMLFGALAIWLKGFAAEETPNLFLAMPGIQWLISLATDPA